MQADGKWKESPLERMYGSSDEAVARLISGFQAGSGGGGGDGGPPSARIIGGSPAMHAAQVQTTGTAGGGGGGNTLKNGPQGQDDIWGALHWLDSLELSQLTALNAANNNGSNQSTVGAAGAAPKDLGQFGNAMRFLPQSGSQR